MRDASQSCFCAPRVPWVQLPWADQDAGSMPCQTADCKSRFYYLQEDLLQPAMDGEEQQRAVLEIADHDGFNWG